MQWHGGVLATMLQLVVLVAILVLPNGVHTSKLSSEDGAMSGLSLERKERFIEPEVVPYLSGGALTYEGSNFVIEGSTLRILSGAMHYFRIVPGYWRDRLLKLKACGFNTVET